MAVQCGRGSIASFTYVLTRSGVLCKFDQKRNLEQFLNVKVNMSRHVHTCKHMHVHMFPCNILHVPIMCVCVCVCVLGPGKCREVSVIV